jgi:hypothetical protein
MGPEQAIRDLILSSGIVTKFVSEESLLSLKHIASNDQMAIDRILWKLGFNPKQYDDSIKRLFMRLKEFNAIILELTPIETENHREKIRAVGVNLFISVEDFLEKLISYNIWLLSTDHFLDNQFEYNLASARRAVPQVLGQKLENDGLIFTWSIDGENTLGTLLRYLDASNN